MEYELQAKTAAFTDLVGFGCCEPNVGLSSGAAFITDDWACGGTVDLVGAS